MKAEWLDFFDFKEEKYYKRPCCPTCSKMYEPTPVIYKSGKYICLNCQKEIEVDWRQKRWIDKMRRVKKTFEKCFSCGSYKMVVKKRRNPATHKWCTCSAQCLNCNMKMIV